MAHRAGVWVFLLAATAAGAGADGKIAWEKADAVLQKAAAAGKPVVWYFVTDQFSKGALPPPVDAIGKADLAFTHDSVLRRKDLFLWVRGDQTLANRFKVRGAPMVVVTDADGDVIHRTSIADAEGLLTAMIHVLKEKYVDAPIAWGGVVRTGPIKKRLLVVGFDDGKGEGLRALEDKMLVKYHKLCEFVRLDAAKDADAAKKWGVKELPAVVICDPMEKLLEKLAGKKTPADVKVALLKSLKKLDEGSRR